MTRLRGLAVAVSLAVRSSSTAPAFSASLGEQCRQSNTLSYAVRNSHYCAPRPLSTQSQRVASSAVVGLADAKAIGSASTPLTFDDFKTIFKGTPTVDLLRAYVVFSVCAIPAFVKHSAWLIKTSKRLLGDTITYGVIRRTFFAHFCAGETSEEVFVTMRALTARGVGGILDYAAEDDVDEDAAPPAATVVPDIFSKAAPGEQVVARTYSYESEVLCDHHVQSFLSAISTAAGMGGQGFVAIKMTGLGNPKLLERVSGSVVELLDLFKRFDLDGNGTIGRAEFDKVYMQLMPDSTAEEQRSVFQWLDMQQSEQIDYVSWSQRLSIRTISERVGPGPHPALQREGTPEWQRRFYERMLSDEELRLVDAMESRVAVLAAAAEARGVRLMVDAEHSYFQPAIDHVAHRMMRRFNTKGHAYIYNTYQAYLKDANPRLQRDMERANREGYKLGVKLVRGAYLELERRRATQLNYESPVWESLQQTHDCYDTCLLAILEQVARGQGEVMFGSHNQDSIQRVVTKMAQLGLGPTSDVFFGQLLGMSDHLTNTLGSSGYKAYKYMPYGMVAQVVPYLLRRATENASIMAGTKQDLQLIGRELLRRATFGHVALA